MSSRTTLQSLQSVRSVSGAAKIIRKEQKQQKLYELKKEYIRAKDPSRPYEKIDEEAKKLKANDPGFQNYREQKNKIKVQPFIPGTAEGVKRRRRKSKKIIRKGGKSRRRS